MNQSDEALLLVNGEDKNTVYLRETNICSFSLKTSIITDEYL